MTLRPLMILVVSIASLTGCGPQLGVDEASSAPGPATLQQAATAACDFRVYGCEGSHGSGLCCSAGLDCTNVIRGCHKSGTDGIFVCGPDGENCSEVNW